jgi:hypothetical protein
MGSQRETVCRPRLELPQLGCTDPRALVIEPLGEEEGREEDECRIAVVTSPVGVPVIHQTTHISIGPRGRPQGPLAPQTETALPTSPTSLTLAAPPQPSSVLPSPEAGPSGSDTQSKLLSPCRNRVLRRFARFVASSGKGRAPSLGTRWPG